MAVEYPTEAQVLDWMTSLSNWGRWGEGDQSGCLNLITPSKRTQAAALVRDVSGSALHGGQRRGSGYRSAGTHTSAKRRGRVHWHGLSRSDDHAHRRLVSLFVAGQDVQWQARQHDYIA